MGENRERFEKTRKEREQKNQERALELFRLKKDGGDAFMRRLREIFSEELLDLATDPDTPALSYLAHTVEKIGRGEKIEYDVVSYETLIRLGQDARLSLKEIDATKEEFFLQTPKHPQQKK